MNHGKYHQNISHMYIRSILDSTCPEYLLILKRCSGSYRLYSAQRAEMVAGERLRIEIIAVLLFVPSSHVLCSSCYSIEGL